MSVVSQILKKYTKSRLLCNILCHLRLYAGTYETYVVMEPSVVGNYDWNTARCPVVQTESGFSCNRSSAVLFNVLVLLLRSSYDNQCLFLLTDTSPACIMLVPRIWLDILNED